MFAYLLKATKEEMNSVRGEQIGVKNAESSTKQLHQENAKKNATQQQTTTKNLRTESSAMM